MASKTPDYTKLYANFQSNISKKVDCGRMCAPLNGGIPVCCSSANAIVIVDRSEWDHLRKQSKVWTKYKPMDEHSQGIVDGLHEKCLAIDCTVAPACQRDQRTLACRAFPFFPYFTGDQELAGISYYWIFEDRCWVLSNLSIVESVFVRELIDTYTQVFEQDDEERQAFVDQSATMRRVFSRRKKPIPLIKPDGSLHKVLPKSGGRIVPAKLSDFGAHDPYTSKDSYRRAVKRAGGDPDQAVFIKM